MWGTVCGETVWEAVWGSMWESCLGSCGGKHVGELFGGAVGGRLCVWELCSFMSCASHPCSKTLLGFVDQSLFGSVLIVDHLEFST